LDELTTHPKSSELLFDHITLCDYLKHDEYRVPPLVVVHSFEADVLEYLRGKLKERWVDFVEADKLLASGVVEELSKDNAQVDHPWIPPLVFLVGAEYYQSTDLWFEVAKLRIYGIAPSKHCLLPSKSAMESDDVTAIKHAKREAREWVAKAHSERFAFAVYPWTVRLEMDDLTDVGGVPSIFPSAKEELKYYFCELKVDGEWAEDVVTAKLVGSEGCDGYLSEESTPKVGSYGPLCV